jgi:3-methyladenine DNA glycosylase AlkD
MTTAFLTQLLNKNANPQQAIAMAAYMKNNFSFLGIPSPKRKELEKMWMKELNITTWKDLKRIAQELRDLPQREYHYIAITLLAKHKKLRVPDSITYFEELIVTNSWWDSVDSIDTNLV